MKYIICRPGIIQHYSYDDALLGSQRCEFGFLLPRANATSCRCRRELGEAANIFEDERERGRGGFLLARVLHGAGILWVLYAKFQVEVEVVVVMGDEEVVSESESEGEGEG